MTEDVADSARHLELSGPADPEIVDLVHAMLDNLWIANPAVADADRSRFEMAVIEILGNIVEHAYAMDADVATTRERRLAVSLTAGDAELVALLADNGKPMPLDLRDVAMPDEMSEAGRGLALATSVLDELDYERVEGRNQWRLLCRRQPTGADAVDPPSGASG